MELEPYVREILADIKRRGIEAIIEYSRKFDNYQENFEVTEEEKEQAAEIVSPTDKNIFREIINKVAKVHEEQLQQDSFQVNNGSIYGLVCRPLERVGLYVPGGRPLPSSLIMTGVPADIAGVEEMVVTSPPDSNGNIDPNLVVIAQMIGIDRLYKLGGIQAIGSMTFGVGMEKVDKIFGPGNKFVNEAKRQVYGKVGIGRLAGPSDLCVIADETARTSYVRKDLLSQLEHGEGSRAWLLTTSQKLAKKLDNLGVDIYLESTLDECIDRCNRLAPEHLELLTEKPLELLDGIRNAGAVYLGENTPASAGDYCLGVNHVLPTGGASRFQSVLTVSDFQKRISVAFSSRREFRKVSSLGKRLAQLEGMEAHKQALDVRNNEKKNQ